MRTYLLRLDLNTMCERLSRSFGCRLGVADVRGLLQSAGFVESPLGWLTHDVRPLMMMFVRRSSRLV
jgi:hypothetical protein